MRKIEELAAEYAAQYPENDRSIAFRAWIDGRLSMESSKIPLEERKRRFMEKLACYVPEYGKEMLREFFDYWTECNANGRKMRYEKEKTFEIDKRLRRWSKNNYRNGKSYQNTGGNSNQSIFGFSASLLQKREQESTEHQGCHNG